MLGLSPAMAAAVAAGTWFGLFVVTQWLVVHWVSSARRARVLVVDYGASLIGFVITAYVLTDDPRRRLLSGIFGTMTISCLFVLYTPFYYVVSNSLSVQSIIVLLERQGRLARADLYEKFAGRQLLQGRLDTLARSGYVVRDGAAFRLTQRGHRLIAPFLALKALWRLGPGG
jgi:hypothetical protein